MGNKPTNELKPKALSDLRKQTNFTEEELQQWYTDFKKDCPQGSLTKKDFAKVYAKFFPLGDATAFTEYVFRTFDSNRDGTISFREFMCGMSVLSKGTAEQKLSWIFSMYDINKDGYISRDEMLEIVEGINRMVGELPDVVPPTDESTPREKVDKIFRNVDKNCDDQLSLEEFLDAAKNDAGISSMLEQ